MVYQSLADLVLLVHLVFIVFVLLGGLLAFRWRWVPMAHLPAAAWGVAVEFFGWVCPLTPLENALRRAGGSTGYSVGFIEQYIVPLVYPNRAHAQPSTGSGSHRGCRECRRLHPHSASKEMNRHLRHREIS